MGSPIDWNAWFAQQQQNPTMGGIAGMGGGLGQQPMPPPPSMPPSANVPLGPPPAAPMTGINPGAPEMFGAPAAQQKKSPEQAKMELYTSLYGQQPGLENVTRQRAMAEQLRQGGGRAMSTRVTQGSRPGAPNIEQAPTGLEFLGQLAQSAGSAYAGHRADTEAKSLAEQQAEALRQYRENAGFK